MLQKAPVNGTTIAYETLGQGEPLLLIHGAGVSRAEFQPQYEAFGQRYRLIVPDVRGHGESGQTSTPYSMKQYSDDMAALLDHLKIDQALVLGHSMGGGVAQQMAVDYPQKVRALVLAETNFGFDSAIMQLLLKVNNAIVRLMGMKTMVSLSVRQFGHTPQEQAILREAFAPQVANPANFWNIYDAIAAFNGREQLKRIQCPTLVMIAQKNRASHGYGRTMAAEISGAQLVTIPNAGHMLNWDNTQAFNQTVIEFFEKVVQR